MAELHLFSPRGFCGNGVYAGIKSKRALDVGLLICDRAASAAAVFTTNRVVSPGVTVGRDHVRRGTLRGVIVNSGNANACTGKQGLADANRMCELAAGIVGCGEREILPSSTGIIGQHLPMDEVERGIRDAGKDLGDSREHAIRFADAILTTDLKRKIAATRFRIGRTPVIIAGACKGSGMIGPRLALGGKHATMLAYLTTDAAIAPPLLRKLLARAADLSFNTVTVDDHASTNDTAAILASGGSGAFVTSAADRDRFAAALNEVCQSLAYQIAADGEGATKVVVITVRRAKNEDHARTIARTIANSPLVKCAMNGNDPNWGRIVSAAGYAGVEFDAERCVLKLAGTRVFANGQPVKFDPARVSKAMASKEVKVVLDCNAGRGEATCWTCDLSKEYVTINADYHT